MTISNLFVLFAMLMQIACGAAVIEESTVTRRLTRRSRAAPVQATLATQDHHADGGLEIRAGTGAVPAPEVAAHHLANLETLKAS
mmetsp:Transcript_21740/g.47724  ORF Transcript_21740/g.47724 Transcript_21740/m.47724 type:complete len:85 (-) Transcript_21740:321-575(-)